ncbi:Ig-like domain-containing protein [Lysinibacillus xylanilyticus]|uniref:Ig-like domain-containing protein n=1 Tax=Lysinibacillus xylanilyticus TaxID=582475 RepID=UPI003D007BAA
MVKYYYDKYASTSSTTWTEGPWAGPYNWSPLAFNDLYKNYGFSNTSNSYSVSGVVGDSVPLPIGYKAYKLNGNVLQEFTIAYQEYGDLSGAKQTVSMREKKPSDSTPNVSYGKGALIQSGIQAEDGTYPANGRHTDGYWYVKGAIVNTAPSIPGAFTKPTATTLLIGATESIEWGASTDPENNLSRYILEVSINGGSWVQIGTPTTNSFSYTIPTATSIQFRVKAQDSGGLESSYRLSNIYTVKKPNQTPTVSLTSPTENVTLYENDTLNISGTAYDADADQSVTVYYQINAELRKVLATNLSQTQITLSKQLKFKAGKLYDGDTAVTGNLSDGIAHKLKVWAVDSENTQSVIVERTFYVVPNRAPLLVVDAVVPSGVINNDKFKISGTASDQDDNSSVKVVRRINNGNAVEIYNGSGGAWEFEIALSQLQVGENTIVVEVIDNYGAKSSKTIKLKKNEIKTPILQSVARYKIEPPKGNAKGVLLFIERDKELDLKVELSMTLTGEQEQYETLSPEDTAPMPYDDNIVEDTFYYEATEPKSNIILKLTMSRTDLSVNHKIQLVSGAVE